MKYVDLLKLQKEYESRKETIKAMRKIKDDFSTSFHGNNNLDGIDLETCHVFKECYSLLKKDIERLRKELNEMEI